MEKAGDILKQVYDSGFNIYALLYKVKKHLGWKRKQNFPEEIVIGVCKQYFKDKDKIEDYFPWFIKVFSERSAQFYAKQNILENDKKTICKELKSLIAQALKK